MRTLIDGRAWDYEAMVGLRRKDVVIVMPHAGSVAMAQLAIDALAKFTTDVHYAVWVSHDQRDSVPRDVHGLIECRTPVERWWQRRVSVAGYAAGIACELAVHVMRASPPTWVFFMHNDALPLKAGWLPYLIDKARESTGIAGVKLTEGTHAAHSSGVLMEWPVVAALEPGELLARMPLWDILEKPTARQKVWTARSVCLRPGYVLDREMRSTLPYWLEGFPCDVSWDDAEPFYAHLGGGTINRRKDAKRWIREARWNLGL